MFKTGFITVLFLYSLPQSFSTVINFDYTPTTTNNNDVSPTNAFQKQLTHELNRLVKSSQQSRKRRELVSPTSWQNGTSDTCKNLKIDGEKFLEKIEIKNSKFSLDGDSNPSVAIAWHGDNTGVLLAVTTKEYVSFDVASFTMSDKSNPSQIYLSKDFGKTFKKLDVDKIFKTDKEKFYIRKSHGVITNNVNSKRVLLIEHPEIINTFGVSADTKGSKIWLNTDVVEHYDDWSEVQLDFQLDGQLIEQHPHDEKCMLVIGAAKNDNRALWITTDGGKKWKKVDDNVHRYRWDPVQKLENDKTKYGFYYTKDPTQMFQVNQFHYELFRATGWSSERTGERPLLAVNVYSFGVQNEFLYVSVKYPPSEGKSDPERIMLVSNDHGQDLQAVQLPNIGHDRFYAILDAHESMIFLHVDEPKDTGYGTIFTSNSQGKIFDRSLQYHLYPNTGDLTDFYKVDAFGAEGTYITSQLLPDKENAIETVITYDKGARWWPIKGDQVKGWGSVKDQTGKECADDICNLQIHNRFSMSKHVAIPKGPYSSKNAPGIIIAHGNMGDALATKNIDVYMTEDGGYQWKKILDGTYHYTIMDQGSIIVAIPAPMMGDKRVNSMKISFDLGECWIDHIFTGDEKVKIEFTGMIVEPGEKQSKLSIWGWGDIDENNPTGNWNIYHVTMEDVLKKCGSGDFESYKAHCDSKSRGGIDNSATGELKNCCRLGEVVEYQIKKKGKHCLVGNERDHEAYRKHKSCTCTLSDYQCDFGYIRTGDGDVTCKKGSKIDTDYDICWLPKGITEEKAKAKHLQIPTKVYRKIPGDKCTGGEQPEKPIETRDLKCKNVDTDQANEGLEWNDDENKLEQIDADCIRIDENGKCIKENLIPSHLFENIHGTVGDVTASEQKTGAGWTVWFGVMIMACLCGMTYWFYYKGNQLPGVLSRFNRYQRMENNVVVDEDEPPLEVGQRFEYTDADDDDILA